MKLFNVCWMDEENNEENQFQNWKINTDSYGHDSIINERINQKINIMKYVKSELKRDDEKGLSYTLPENVHVVNSYSNMNLSLMQNPKNDKSYDGQNILYFIYDNKNYRLLEWELIESDLENPVASIMYTFRKKDDYNGCAIMFDVNIARENGYIHDGKDTEDDEKEIKLFPIISITMDKKTVEDGEEFWETLNSTLYYCISSDGSESIRESPTNFLEDTNLIHKINISGQNKKFMPSPIKGRGATLAYLINKNVYEKVRDKLSENLTNAVFIAVDPESLKPEDDVDENGNPLIVSKALDKTIRNNFVNNKLRAITTVNLKVPKDFCKTYRFLYLFNYNITTEVSTCIVGK